MRSTLPRTLVLIALAPGLAFSQKDGSSPLAPRVVIKLPGNLAPDAVWIRYMVDRRISAGERMHLANNRQYVIPGVRDENGKPESVKVVLYSPGCEFKIYDLQPVGDSVEQQFQCDALPTKKLRAFIPASEIPNAIYWRLERRLDVVGELEADWMCSYFIQPPPGSSEAIAGSCLGSGVPLGPLGTIDPAKQGSFEISIPDFGRDPVFKRAADDWKTSFGIIEMSLHDKKAGVGLGMVKPKSAENVRPGLSVQMDYPETILFTRVR